VFIPNEGLLWMATSLHFAYHANTKPIDKHGGLTMLDAIRKPAVDQEMFDDVIAIKPTQRIEKLRQRLLSLKLAATIDRARIETRVMKETEGEITVTRRGKVFAAVVREMPINIYPDELIAGHLGVKQWSDNVSPADGPGLEAIAASPAPKTGVTKDPEATHEPAAIPADASGHERYDLSGLSEEDRRELREELIPYWRGEGNYEKTSGGIAYQRFPSDLRDLYFADPEGYPPAPSLVTTYNARSGHYGHNIVNYKKVLDKGFLGIKAAAEERLAGIDLSYPEEAKKVPFLEGVVLAMEAAAEIGSRHAALARELARKEEDPIRKAELLKLAKVCDRVPANPAATFHEAIQSCFLAWLLLPWEQPLGVGHSTGRMDQLLYPYYERDMREGHMTKEEAQELLDCYIIKLNQAEYHGGHTSVGGMKPDGSDGTNELTYMLIEAVMHTRLKSPYFDVQIHSNSPDALLIKAAQLCSLGTGHPQFVNSDVMTAQAMARGSLCRPAISLEHARSADPIGCCEPVIPGFDSGYSYMGGHSNLAAAMEFVMSNGWSRVYNRKMGLETGDPRQFKSFEDVKGAYRKQVAWFSSKRSMVCNIGERATAELAPTVYESALIDDCIEKGISREEGGARYNQSGIQSLGSSDAADSLTAIKKLVFEDKRITMDQLCEALDNNFEGYDEIRRMLLKAPKFGNDDDYADEQKAWVSHVFAVETAKQKNSRGGRTTPYAGDMASYVPFGNVVGALPSGRLSREPLGDAFSPCAGCDLKGPTAVLKSMGKVDHVEYYGGTILNMRMDPAIFEKEDGIKRLVDFIRSFLDQKVFHMQINVVSSDTLKAAQEEPDDYRDLLVKVAGYSAYFVQLGKSLQDGIIARTEHGL